MHDEWIMQSNWDLIEAFVAFRLQILKIRNDTKRTKFLLQYRQMRRRIYRRTRKIDDKGRHTGNLRELYSVTKNLAEMRGYKKSLKDKQGRLITTSEERLK